METLIGLALLGIAALGMGIWLFRGVFKEVSLKDTPSNAGKAVQKADALGLQLAIAEDLQVDPVTLNALADQVQLAREDAADERARQAETATQTTPVTAPWFAPAPALHQIATNRTNANPPGN
jgi:hypothetical protein